MKVRVRDLLEFLGVSRGEEALARAVKEAVNRARVLSGLGLDHDGFLKHHQMRALYQKAVGDTVRDHTALERVLRRLRIPATQLFSCEDRSPPWDDWVDDKTVVVVLGGRPLPNPHSDLTHYHVGARDTGALAQLDAVLRREIGISYRLEVVTVHASTNQEPAAKELDVLLRRKDVGAIVVLGSELVNPMAAPLARRIFDDLPVGALPARFQWNFEWEGAEPFLSDPRACKPGKEGIVYAKTGKLLARVHDQEIIKNRGRPGKTTFPDCGILVMDSRSEQLLVLCAGHGGCGTRAAVLGLARSEYLEKQFDASVGPNPRIGRRRVFEPLWVKRRKPSADAVDDLTFEKAYGVGWKFALDPTPIVADE